VGEYLAGIRFLAKDVVNVLAPSRERAWVAFFVI
jgi:hypothetical protein